MSGKKYPSESDEQIGFLQWFDDRFEGVWIFHIPNGGHRAMSVAKKMKAEGVKKGVPDLYIPEWKLWIEMKRQKNGSVSKDQADWHEYLQGIGDTVIVAKGARDASRQVLEFLQERRQ